VFSLLQYESLAVKFIAHYVFVWSIASKLLDAIFVLDLLHVETHKCE